MKYKNPILKGFYPDPSICVVGDDYYLINSSFEYLPGVPIFHSKNLINWTQIGHCITRSSQITLDKAPPSLGIFAPTIRYHKGMYYIITTNILQINKGNYYFKTNNINAEWSDPIWINIHGIDPSLLFDDDKVYVQYCTTLNGVEGIAQSELDIETGELLTEPKIISCGSGGRCCEGPHMYKINGYYYLLTAEGGTEAGHMVTIRRSKNVWGPFEECPHNPIVTNRDKINQLLQNVGHADLFKDHNGNWWIVALAVRSIDAKDYLGRETILLPVTWSKDNWPIVHKGYAESIIDANLPSIAEETDTSFIDDFNDNKLAMRWNTIRDFSTELYSLHDREGYLTLFASQNSLSDLDKTSFIGCRQADFDCEVITKLNFDGRKNKEEAGITVFMDYEHHMDLFISGADGKTIVNVRKTVADVKSVTSIKITTTENIYLKIIGNAKEYSFYYSLDGCKYIFLDKTYTKHLSVQSAYSRFTGVYLGMYATSNGEVSNCKAQFDFFSYKNLENN